MVVKGIAGVFIWIERVCKSTCAPVSCWHFWALPPSAWRPAAVTDRPNPRQGRYSAPIRRRKPPRAPIRRRQPPPLVRRSPMRRRRRQARRSREASTPTGTRSPRQASESRSSLISYCNKMSLSAHSHDCPRLMPCIDGDGRYSGTRPMRTRQFEDEDTVHFGISDLMCCMRTPLNIFADPSDFPLWDVRSNGTLLRTPA